MYCGIQGIIKVAFYINKKDGLFNIWYWIVSIWQIDMLYFINKGKIKRLTL